MLATVLPLLALFISVSFVLAGSGLAFTLLPIRGELEGFSAATIGLIGSAYFLGFSISCFKAPLIIQRVGHIRTFTGLAALVAVCAVSQAMLVDPYSWILLRALTGFCMAGLYMVIESWLNDQSTNQNRGRLFSLYAVVNLTVVTIGQLLVNAYDPSDALAFSLVAVLVCLSIVPLSMSTAPAPAPPKTTHLRLRKLYAASPAGLASCLGVGLANGSIWAVGPVFALGMGFSIFETSLFMSAIVLGGAVSQWPLGWVSDRMDRRRVMLLCTGGATATGLSLWFFAPDTVISALPLAFTFGAFAFPLNAISVAHTNDKVGREDAVEAAGALNLTYGIGAVIGPIVASTLMTFSQPGALFLYTAAVHAGIAGFIVWRLRVRSAPSGQEKAGFAMVPNASPEAFSLDPRTQPSPSEKPAG